MISGPALLDALRQYRLLDEDQLDRFLRELPHRDADARTLADELAQRGLLTAYQAGRLLNGEAAELTLGQHIIIDRLGEGGMGQVLKARHRRLKRIDAIKIIRPDCLTNKLAVKRFFLEAEVVARLDHPNIIRVYDAAEDGDRHYFVMEYVPGVDLANLVAEKGALPLGLACEYIRQAALGLQHAQEKHLVHRDIKPSNLLATREQIVKVLDLGLAQLRMPSSEGEDEARPLTPHGMIMGTPDFMAPEQAENSSRVDIRADIYSLGCSFYQLLTGSVPYPGGSLVDKLTRHNSAPVPPLGPMRGDLPPGLAGIVEKMMAKRLEDRYQQPVEVALALAPFSDLVGAPQTVPGPRSTGTGSSQSPYIPQTLQEPPTGVPASQWSPPRIAPASRTVPLPDQPSTPVSRDAPTQHMGTRPVPAPAPSRSKPVLALMAIALLVAGGVAGFLLWPRQGGPAPAPLAEKKPEPPPLPEPPKVMPKEEPKVKPKEEVIVNPLVKPVKLPGEGKAAQSGPIDAGDRPAPTPPGPAVARDGRFQRVEVLVDQFEVKCDRAALSADGRHALTGTSKRLTHYPLTPGAKGRTIDPFVVSPSGLISGGNTLGAVALSADGKAALWVTIATTEEPVNGTVSLTAEYDAVVRDDSQSVLRFYGDLWSPAPGKPKPPTRCLACSPNGKTLVTGSTYLRRWDMTLRPKVYDKRSAINTQLEDEALCVACSPDSKWVVAGCKNKELYLYPMDRDSDAPLCEFREHTASPRCVAFVGKEHIVSGDNSGQVCLWKVPAKPSNDGVKPEALSGAHTLAVLCAAGSKDDLYATGGADGVVRVGKIGSKDAVLSETFPDEVRALVFSEDGKQLLVITSRQLVAVRLTPPAPEAAGKSGPGEAGLAKGR